MATEGYTDIGLGRYNVNQDSFLTLDLDVDGIYYQVLLVCDGMGGLADGQIASSTLVRNIEQCILTHGVDLEKIKRSIVETNDLLYDSYSEDKSGTTCSLVIIGNGRYEVLHIGDSRVYLFRGEGYKQLTKDHTYLNNLIKKGVEITPEIRKKYQSVLSRCIGVMLKPRIDSASGTTKEGDVFIACSDGFWHYWDFDYSDLPKSIERLKRTGERDNITVVYAKVERSFNG